MTQGADLLQGLQQGWTGHQADSLTVAPAERQDRRQDRPLVQVFAKLPALHHAGSGQPDLKRPLGSRLDAQFNVQGGGSQDLLGFQEGAQLGPRLQNQRPQEGKARHPLLRGRRLRAPGPGSDGFQKTPLRRRKQPAVRTLLEEAAQTLQAGYIPSQVIQEA